MGFERTRIFKYAKEELSQRNEVTTDEAKEILLGRYPNAKLDSLKTSRILRRLGFRKNNHNHWRNLGEIENISIGELK